MYPIEKYKFVVRPARVDKNGEAHGPEVIAISHYAGQTIKGVAKCSPNDEFDLEYGKRLAAARCNQKVCEKRAVTLIDKVRILHEQIAELQVLCSKLTEHKLAALVHLSEATNHTAEVENEIN